MSSDFLNNIRNAMQFDNEIIKEKEFEPLLNAICISIIKADVDVRLVVQVKEKIKKKFNFDDTPDGVKKPIFIQAVSDALIEMMDPKVESFKPIKGKSNVILFMGVKGCGKTTTIIKLARYYKLLNYSVAVVCTDNITSKSLLSNRHKIPYFYSYNDTDPVRVVEQGVETFKKENIDIILVDTKTYFKQMTDDFFDEMLLFSNAVKPDNVVLIVDGNLGQIVQEPVSAFKSKVDTGSVIITKMDEIKGVGTLSSVASLHIPISFLGTGEHIDDLEKFEPSSFVSRIVCTRPVLHEPEDSSLVGSEDFSFRDLKDQLLNIKQCGIRESAIPEPKIDAYISILDSMNDEELDDSKVLNASRIQRIANGSGHTMEEVNDLINLRRKFVTPKTMPSSNVNSADIVRKLPPGLLRQMGGIEALERLLQQMSSHCSLR